MLYFFIIVINLIVSTFFFKKAAGTLKITKLNMISWIYYYEILLQTFIASILVIYSLDDHYLINKIQDFEVKKKAFYAVQYGIFMLSFGMYLTTILYGKSSAKRLLETYIHKQIVPVISRRDKIFRLCLYLLSVFCILNAVYMFYTIGSIPLLSVLKNYSHDTLANIRQLASSHYSGNQYLRNIFVLTLPPILSYIFYSYYKLYKTRTDLYWFLLMFIVSFFTTTYDLSKSPLIVFLIGFLMLQVLLNVQFRYWQILRKFSVYLLVLVAIYLSMSGVDKVIDLLFDYNNGITGRLILSQSAGTYLMFDAFPSKIDHIHFSSISKLLPDLLGIEYSERSSRLIQYIYNIKAVDNNEAGVMNSFFIGEAWANFGFIGVLIAPIYVGFIIQNLYLFFLRNSKTPMLLGLFAYFSVKSCLTGGFNDYFYNIGYILIFLIFLLTYLITKSIYKSKV